MSSRKPGFLIGLFLLSVILSTPQLLIGFGTIAEACVNKRLPTLEIPGLGPTQTYANVINYLEFWHDRFVEFYPAEIFPSSDPNFTSVAIDPETGQKTDLRLGLSGGGYVTPFVFEHRLWLVGLFQHYEVIDGTLKESDFIAPRTYFDHDAHFLWNGEAASIEQAANGIVVNTFQAGAWGNNRLLVLPDPTRGWMFGQTEVRFNPPTKITCISHGDQIHLFLQIDGRLLYREGLELQPTQAITNPVVQPSGNPDGPASALRAVNTDAQIAGWSLACQDESCNLIYLTGLLVGGEPAALMVDDRHTGHPVGHLFRYDGATWSRFGTQVFPLATNQFRVVRCHDGQKSYIMAATAMGKLHLYAVEPTGVRETSADWGFSPRIFELIVVLLLPIAVLIQGTILGAGIGSLMSCYMKRDYGFGNRSVKLASIGRRGLARLIDLSLIVCSSAALGWAMTIGLDWESFLESLNVKIAHPTIPIATRAAIAVTVWLAGVISALLIVQGRSGVTPGKWCCGLRALRTTLKPCGFAGSFARELVLSVDACCFFCWTPALLSIALTDHRQRLGDLVADTVVIEV